MPIFIITTVWSSSSLLQSPFVVIEVNQRRSNVVTIFAISFSFDIPFFPAFTGLFSSMLARSFSRQYARSSSFHLPLETHLMRNYCFPYLFHWLRTKEKKLHQQQTKTATTSTANRPIKFMSSKSRICIHAITFLHFSQSVIAFFFSLPIFLSHSFSGLVFFFVPFHFRR